MSISCLYVFLISEIQCDLFTLIWSFVLIKFFFIFGYKKLDQISFDLMFCFSHFLVFVILQVCIFLVQVRVGQTQVSCMQSTGFMLELHPWTIRLYIIFSFNIFNIIECTTIAHAKWGNQSIIYNLLSTHLKKLKINCKESMKSHRI